MEEFVQWNCPTGHGIIITSRQEKMLRDRKTWPYCEYHHHQYCQVIYEVYGGSPMKDEDLIGMCPEIETPTKPSSNITHWRKFINWIFRR